MWTKLAAPLHGLVLDHLEFADVLRATTTSSGGRYAMEHINVVSRMNPGFQGKAWEETLMLKKLKRCEVIRVAGAWRSWTSSRGYETFSRMVPPSTSTWPWAGAKRTARKSSTISSRRRWSTSSSRASSSSRAWPGASGGSS